MIDTLGAPFGFALMLLILFFAILVLMLPVFVWQIKRHILAIRKMLEAQAAKKPWHP